MFDRHLCKLEARVSLACLKNVHGSVESRLNC